MNRAAHVQAHGDEAAVVGDDALGPLGVLQGGGAEVDAGGAGLQGPGQGGVVADAAGQLDLDADLADDAGEELGVGPAAEGGVEVDQVDPLGAGLGPVAGRVQGVAVVGLGSGL